MIIMNRRNGAPATGAGESGEAADSADTPREMAAADVNGQGQQAT